MRYRKTELIDAEQFDGSDEMAEKYDMWKSQMIISDWWLIETHESIVRVYEGDWIATGIDGEHWPIADDIFKRTYEPATETTAQQECPYCSTSDSGVQKKLLINEPSVKLEAWIEPVWEGDGCFIHVQYDNYENAGRVIHYCPMCGRKLGEDDE